MVFFIILSAGKGTRLGINSNKGLVKISGKTILERNIEKVLKYKFIDQILVLTNQETANETLEIIRKFKSKKLLSEIILGGKERQDSAKNGFLKCLELGAKEKDIVIINNVANLFFKEKEIKELIKATKMYGSAVLAQKVYDTIREVDHNLLGKKIIDREKLYKMQTPQALTLEILKQAYLKIGQKKINFTDDVALSEYLGIKPKIVLSNDFNFKITTRENLKIAEFLIKNKLV